MSKYNIVAIDPSLISTAMVVGKNDGTFKIFNYCKESSAMGKKGMNKWFKMAEQYVSYRYIDYRKFDNYSDGELVKLKDYDKVSDVIINDILENIDKNIPTKIGIEGFSYSSNAGSLIDLVTFSTILRKKLFDLISEDITVLSPSTLKLETCKMTYKPIEIYSKTGKLTKTEYKNNLGIAGGKFTKNEMYLSILDNDNINNYWSNHCKLISEDMNETSKISKPYDDINDSFWIYQIIKNQP